MVTVFVIVLFVFVQECNQLQQQSSSGERVQRSARPDSAIASPEPPWISARFTLRRYLFFVDIFYDPVVQYSSMIRIRISNRDPGQLKNAYPPGSGSISMRYVSGSASFYNRAKIIRT